MKLYLNDKEKSITFLNLLDIMLNSIIDSGKLDLTSLESILNIEKYDDPVLSFIKYYIKDSHQESNYPEGRIVWIKNALYSAKGAPEVIRIIEEALDLDIDYVYEVPSLKIVSIKKLEVVDAKLFCDKFKVALYYLMYFDIFNLIIKELVLRILENLSQTNYISIKGFVNLTSELEDDLISFN